MIKLSQNYNYVKYKYGNERKQKSWYKNKDILFVIFMYCIFVKIYFIK
jgi:hypothetical protein